MIKIVLEDSGIDPERFALEWASAAESSRFTEIVTQFTEKIRALGPNTSRTVSAKPASDAEQVSEAAGA